MVSQNAAVIGALDAENNWWGDVTGPYDNKTLSKGVPNYNNPGGLGNAVSSYVDYRPWCTTTTYDTDVWVENADGDILLYTDTIQHGIDYADVLTWYKVIVSDGTYLENVVVDKDVTINSESGAATTFIKGTAYDVGPNPGGVVKQAPWLPVPLMVLPFRVPISTLTPVSLLRAQQVQPLQIIPLIWIGSIKVCGCQQ